jgi:cytochrome c-type biogenesis protein CcmH/NrfG
MLRVLFQMFGNYYSQGNLGSVEIIVRSILATVPGDMASLQFLGLVYYRTGRTSDAIHVFDMAAPTAQTLTPIEGPADADFLSRNGYSAAAACQLEATGRSAGLAKAWYDVGLTLVDLGHASRAVSAFRAALISRPSFPAAELAVDALTAHMKEHGALDGESLRLALHAGDANPSVQGGPRFFPQV